MIKRIKKRVARHLSIFTQSLATNLAAKVVWCLISGHAVNPSMGARSRLPVSHGPETRHHTPSASWVSEQGVDSDRYARHTTEAGAGGYYQDRTRQAR